MEFQPAFPWRNPHLQTVSRGLFRLPQQAPWSRMKLESSYGDFLSVDRCDCLAQPQRRLLILHGITGCSGASPIPELALEMSALGVETWVLNLRGADRGKPEIPRLYHAGCSEDLDAIFGQLPQELPWRFIGFSLGANLLLKWLGEGRGLHIAGAKAMAISCPFDLAQCSENLEKTFLTRLYRFVLVRRLKSIVRNFLMAHPSALDWRRVRACRTFFDFDEHITAPLHGFEGALDYWSRNSSVQFLENIKIPTLLLHAMDDPFQPNPPHQIRTVCLDWEIHQHGGHVGFQEGWASDWLVKRMAHFVLT